MATRIALFVIDIQNDLATDPKTRIPTAERIRTAGNRILSTARAILDRCRADKTGSPPPALIVFVQHEEEPESGPLVRGTEPWKLVFEPRDGVDEELLIFKSTG